MNTEITQPHYKGRGNHTKIELESLCEQYEAYFEKLKSGTQELTEDAPLMDLELESIIKRDARLAKMQFMSDHKFDQDLQHLRTQKDAVSDMFFDYRKAVEDLKDMLNAWNS